MFLLLLFYEVLKIRRLFAFQTISNTCLEIYLAHYCVTVVILGKNIDFILYHYTLMLNFNYEFHISRLSLCHQWLNRNFTELRE